MFHYDAASRSPASTWPSIVAAASRGGSFRTPTPTTWPGTSWRCARRPLPPCIKSASAPRPTRLLPFGEPLRWDELRLGTHPAGHVLGSAMLLVGTRRAAAALHGRLQARRVRDGRSRRTAAGRRAGDGKHLRRSARIACRRASEVDRPARWRSSAGVLDVGPHAGDPGLRAGQGPGSHENPAQATAFRVVQHPLVFAISQIYEANGCPLGDVRCLRRFAAARRRGGRSAAHAESRAACGNLARPVTIAVTGWAVDPARRRRLGVDYAVPLSDHADYDELLECIERVGPARHLLHPRPRGIRGPAPAAGAQRPPAGRLHQWAGRQGGGRSGVALLTGCFVRLCRHFRG